MTAMSDWLENQLLEHVLRNNAMVSPVSVRLALFLTDPTDAGSGTEVSGGSYARQTVVFNAAAGGQCTNAALITFPTATASWGTIRYAAIYEPGGNMMFHAKLNNPEQVRSGDTYQIAAGALIVSLQ